MCPADFDPTARFVRVTGQQHPPFVEFAFAIGDPTLSVELVLPEAAFQAFCQANQVTLLAPLDTEAGDWAARLRASQADEEGHEQQAYHCLTRPWPSE